MYPRNQQFLRSTVEITMVLIRYTAFMALCMFLLCVHGSLSHAASLESEVKDITSELADAFPLRGAVVQLAPDSFTHGADGRVFELSRTLSAAFSAALVEQGAGVSLQEQGDEPLRLLGVYEVGPETITVTVRLRRMGREVSTDIAVSQASFDRDEIGEELVTDSLGQAAQTLVKQLEHTIILRHSKNFTLQAAVPAGSNRPTLRLGKVFHAAVDEAMADSELFGAISFGVQTDPVGVVPTYDVRQGAVQLELHLKDDAGAAKSSVQTSLDRSLVTEDLLQPFDDRGVDVCVGMVAQRRRDVKPESSRGEALILFLQHALLEGHGIHTSRCNDDFGGRKVLLTLKQSVRKTAEGYGFVTGQLRSEVTGAKGNQLGVARTTARVTGVEDRMDKEALVGELLTNTFVSELAALVLIYP